MMKWSNAFYSMGTLSRSNWNLEMLVFEVRGKPESPCQLILTCFWACFQIPEARTQALFTDCQLHIWAVEGEMIYAVDTHIQRPI